MVIARSKDEGTTWSTPVTLFHGSFATGPTPVISLNGTLYRTMEGPDDPSKALVVSRPLHPFSPAPSLAVKWVCGGVYVCVLLQLTLR